MPYVTPAQLADSPRAQEVAQCATPEDKAIVATDLMDAVLRGTSTAGFLPADVAVANQVLVTVNAMIDEADQLIDGFIGKRYTLPLTTPPEILGGWARAIVRYKLNKNNITDEKTNPIARDYRDAMNLLQLIAAGKFSLGAGDPTGSGGSGLTQISVPGRTFDNDTLNDFTLPL
jgi:phage gp36-like protein